MNQLLCIPRTADAAGKAMAAVAEASSWVMVIGHCQADLLEVALASPAAVLAVVPDGLVLNDLREHWAGHWPERLQIAEQLIGAEAGEQAWFHYNDPRHNGPLGPDALGGRHTNLKLERLELREQISLHEALQSWEPAQQAEGALVLIGAWGADLLHQAGGRLQQLHRVLWLLDPSDRAPDTMALAQLDQQLQLSWLVRDASDIQPQGGFLWERDPRLQFEATVLAERDQLLVQRDSLTAERDALAAERNGMQEQFDAINRELDEILALIDQTQADPVGASAQE